VRVKLPNRDGHEFRLLKLVSSPEAGFVS